MTQRKTIGRDAADGYLEVTLELREDPASQLSDGFSVTGSLWEGTNGRTRARNGLEPDAGGCIHDEVRRAAPELEPLLRLHLADPDGTPMHAVANGWYFYSGDARRYEEKHPGSTWRDPEWSDHERAAHALAIHADDLPTGIPDRETFADYCELVLVPRWRKAAGEARELLAGIVDGAGQTQAGEKLGDFIAAHAITGDVEHTGTGEHGANLYRVTLRAGGESLTIPYSMGAAREREPTIGDALEAIVRDLSYLEEANIAGEDAGDVDPGEHGLTPGDVQQIEAHADGLRALVGARGLELLRAELRS